VTGLFSVQAKPVPPERGDEHTEYGILRIDGARDRLTPGGKIDKSKQLTEEGNSALKPKGIVVRFEDYHGLIGDLAFKYEVRSRMQDPTRILAAAMAPNLDRIFKPFQTEGKKLKFTFAIEDPQDRGRGPRIG